MNFEPIRKHNFVFYITGIPNFHLIVEWLNWNIIDKTIDTTIRMFTDDEKLSSCLLSKNQGKFQSKLCLLSSTGDVVKTFIFDKVIMKKQIIEMKCSYNAPANEVMLMNIVFSYKTYKEI